MPVTYGAVGIGAGLLALSGWLVVQLVLAQHQAPTPQAILVLEGQTSRVRFAAEFSGQHPSLPLWVSGNPQGQALNEAIFQQAEVPEDLVHYDGCATDTVTNFTCTLPDLTARDIRHVYVITSDYHMARARAIAAIVFGSRGIVVTPVALAAPHRSPESPLRTVRDCLRSLIWLATGKTGASLNPG
nr:YdcF family protein [Nodosilinea sp. FACHB-131]